jgi:hypothetical protein
MTSYTAPRTWAAKQLSPRPAVRITPAHFSPECSLMSSPSHPQLHQMHRAETVQPSVSPVQNAPHLAGVPQSRSVPRVPLAADHPSPPRSTILVIMRRNLHAGLGWAHNKVARNESEMVNDVFELLFGKLQPFCSILSSLSPPQPHGYRHLANKAEYCTCNSIVSSLLKKKTTRRVAVIQTQAFNPTHEMSTPQFPQKKSIHEKRERHLDSGPYQRKKKQSDIIQQRHVKLLSNFSSVAIWSSFPPPHGSHYQDQL